MTKTTSKATTEHGAKAPPRCATCGKGHFLPTQVMGQAFRFRDEPAVVINEPLELPVCDVCGEMRLSVAMVDAFEAALERSYEAMRQAQTVQMVAQLKDKLRMRQSDIERVLGVSVGYASKALRGEKTLGPSTYRLLRVLSAAPRETLHALAEVDPEVRKIEERAVSRGALATA